MSSLRSGPAGAGPVLVVRTRQSDHRLQAGTDYRLGRDPASDIVINDARVSWAHAVIRHEQDVWMLEDAGIKNGTFVGTARVDRITISADCVLRLGNADDGPVLRCEPAARPVHAPTQVSGPSAAGLTTVLADPPRPVRDVAAPVFDNPAPVFDDPATVREDPAPALADRSVSPEVRPSVRDDRPPVRSDRPAAGFTPVADRPATGRPGAPGRPGAGPSTPAPSGGAGTPAGPPNGRSGPPGSSSPPGTPRP